MAGEVTYEIQYLGAWVPVARGNLVKGWLHWERRGGEGGWEFGMAPPGRWRVADPARSGGRQEPQEGLQEAPGEARGTRAGQPVTRGARGARKAGRKA